MFSGASVILLLVSAGLASRVLTRRVGLRFASEPLATAIAFGTLWVGWSLAVMLLVALAAMLSGRSLVRTPIVAGASLTLVGLLLILSRRRPCVADDSIAPKSGPACRWWPGWGIFCVAVLPVAGLHLFLLAMAMLRPPAGSDSLVYHLPLIVRWLRSGQLGMTPGIWQYCQPGNGEAWQMLFAATGVERLIEPAMLPIGLLCAAVVAGLARSLGAGTRAAVICACLTLASPMFAMQSYGTYVDLFSATFLLASCYWVIRLGMCGHGGQRVGVAALAGLSLGLAVGARLLVLAWVGPVMLAFLLAARKASNKDAAGGGRRKSFALLVGVFVIGVSVCSAYWYVRNGVQTGWPLYPVNLHICGHEIGAGLPAPRICQDLAAGKWLALSYPWVEHKRHGYPYSIDAGLGPMFAVCALPGVAYLIARRTRWRRQRLRFVDLVMLGLVGVGVVLFVKVFFGHARYVLPLWLLVFVSAGPMWGLLMRYRARTGLTLLGVVTWLSAAMIALWPAKTLLGHVAERDLSRWAWYELPKSLEELPAGTVILNMSRGMDNYPLLGRGWRNVVIDTLTAADYGLQAPLSKADLEARGIEVVVGREADDPASLFRPEVRYEEMAGGAKVSKHVSSRAYRRAIESGQGCPPPP